MKTIGIVGLGIMGSGIADNFLKKGYTVYVWNRTAAAGEQFAARGAVVCGTPQEAAQRADIIFEVTANDQSSREVWTGETGILAGAQANSILIANATLSIDWVDELAELCRQKNLQFLDLPMTGGRVGAETGQLTLLCGGDEQLLNSLRPILEAIAAKVLYFGPAGHGMRYKLLLNALQAIHLLGLGEALKVATQAQMDIQKVGDALVGRPGGAITELGWRDFQTKPNPINFSIDWIAKDLTYARRFAQKLELPLLDAALAQYQALAEQGHGKEDWARITNLQLDEQ
jgi:3-hydroxyisobutyrate dehydrogenase-like beta-hydroxyacid dehydrogenase